MDTDSAILLIVVRAAIDLALDEADRPDDRVEERLELGHEAPVLSPPGGRDRVEAPRATVGVLPLTRDQPTGLQVTEERIDRVRVDRDHAVADGLDLLDQ